MIRRICRLLALSALLVVGGALSGWAADVAFRASSLTNGYNGTAPSVSAPTGTATGDLVIVYLHGNGTGTCSDNNGGNPFTLDYQRTESVSGSIFCVFSRIIGGDTAGPYNFTISASSSRTTVYALAFSDPNPTAIYDVAPSVSFSSQIENTSGPGDVDGVSITTGFDNSIAIIGTGQDLNASAGAYDQTPTGYTALTGSSASTAQLAVVAYQTITPAGSTGTPDLSTNVWGAGQWNMSVHFAIRNNTGGGGGSASHGMMLGVGR